MCRDDGGAKVYHGEEQQQMRTKRTECDDRPSEIRTWNTQAGVLACSVDVGVVVCIESHHPE